MQPIDPLKCKRNGGGALIATRVSLSTESKTNLVNCTAELLALELSLPIKAKIIVATCYRVGININPRSTETFCAHK